MFHRLSRQLVPGVYEDRKRQIHVDVPARLRHQQIPDTPVNRRAYAAQALSELRIELMNEIPRRIRMDLMSPAELAITKAMYAVEEMPADIRLTEAGNLLQQARDKVADFIDARPASASSLTPSEKENE